MSHRIVARMASASAITALLLGVLATPAAATGHTNRWVDDDLTAGDGPDQCDTAAYSSIQAAIDDSSSGDTVFVCPGTYEEQLTLANGVRVWARPLRAATIQAPGAGSGTLVTITGNNAVVRGFRMNFPADVPVPVLKPTFVTCANYDAAVWAKGTNDRVRDNFITAVGAGTLNGPCGYDYGIVVGTTLTSASARVTFNWITDFKIGGILAQGADSDAWIRRNTVRFFHANDCAIIAISCTISLRPSVNGGIPVRFGIGVEAGARADIRSNWVGSGRDACSTGPSYSCSPGATPTLGDGITLTGLDGSETTDVRDNVVTRTAAGIVTRVAADGAVIHDNWVYNSHYGYWPLGDNDEWHHNHTQANDYGIDVNGSGNNIHDNDFRGNLGTDCQDETSASAATVANTWTNDLGNIDSPDGICIPDAT